MKKLLSTLIILVMLVALATSASAMGIGGEMTELVLGENVAEFVVEYYEDYDEYFGMPAMFQWVAPEAGTLTIDFSDEDEFAAYANIYVFDLEGGQSWYGIEEKGGQVSMQVSEGYTVMMEVGCMDMLTEAGTIFFNFTMTMGEATEPSDCTHEYTYLEPDPENEANLIEYCNECGAVLGVHAPGTQKNPIMVDFLYDEVTMNLYGTVTVPAGQSLWFGQYRIGGMILVVNGVEYGMLEDAGFYDPVVFELTNDTDEDVTYEIQLTWPLGTDYNPDELPVNDSIELYLPENSYEYVYRWFATEDGELTITIEGENWMFVVNNYTTYVYGDKQWDCYGDPNTITVQVSAGDEIVLYVGTDDGNWGTPEATLTITTVFTAAGAETGCAHEYTYLEPDPENEANLIEYCNECGAVLGVHAPGTQKNPILVDFLYDEVTMNLYGTVTVPAGESLWFGQYRIGGMILNVNGVEYGMLEDAGFYDPVVFELTNDTDADVTYEILLTWPLGSDYNPGELPVNDSTELYLPENSYEFAYQWFATADGELTITIEGENWLFHVNNYTSYVYGDCYYDCYGDANTVTIQVAAGDEIMLYVGTMDADWNTPEATLTITTVFACAHKNLVHVEAVVPGCYEEGNIEHWYCEDCEIVWADEALTQVTNHKSVILPATHQHVVHVEAVAPTCTEHGNVEYWYCEDCLTVWVDEAMLQISNMKNIVDPAIGHNYVDGVCANCGENDKNVPDTGDMIALACVLSAVSGMTIIALPKKKEN